jgi:N6-adenosine-specific RNA methylase IME4
MSNFFALHPSSFVALPQYQARVILADPLWYFENCSAKSGGMEPVAHYACMSLDDIQHMPVRELANPSGCLLIMWAIAPAQLQGYRVEMPAL